MTAVTSVIAFDAPEFAGLPVSKAEQIRATFVPMADALVAMEDQYNGIMARAAQEVTPALSAEARRLRLDIAKLRVAAEHARKGLKEEYLLAGRAIDGANNILKWAISAKEDCLEAIEKHVERVEAERVAALYAERAVILNQFEVAVPTDLGSMPEDVWLAYSGAKEREYQDRIAAEEAAAVARENQERRRRIEVARLKAMAPVHAFLPVEVYADPMALTDEEFDATMIAATQAREAKAQEAAAERLRNDQVAREAAEAATALQRERDRAGELERIEARRAADRQAAALQEARDAERAAAAPVKLRLSTWVGTFTLPDLPGEGHQVEDRIREGFERFRTWANTRIGEIGEVSDA